MHATHAAVLVDTDIGSDIDDAVALAYLLAHPEAELVGITTVSGNTEQRAACAEALCEVAGANVAVHAGLSGPLLDGAGQPDVPQYAAIATRVATSRARDAVEFMRATIRARPGEIELLTIGPLTNVAVLFALDPEIPSLLRGMTSMGGWYFDDRSAVAEWNIVVDPVAAAIAFRHAPDPHVCVGIDVTQGLTMSCGDVEEYFARTPLLRTVLDMARIYFEQSDHVTFHDPLAAAVVFAPALCEFRRGDAEVNTAPEAGHAAATAFTPNEHGNARAARTVNQDAFFAEYFRRTLPA